MICGCSSISIPLAGFWSHLLSSFILCPLVWYYIVSVQYIGTQILSWHVQLYFRNFFSITKNTEFQNAWWEYFKCRCCHLSTRYLSRFFDCLAHPNLSATLATDQKWPLSCRRISYQSLAECHLPYYWFPKLVLWLMALC